MEENQTKPNYLPFIALSLIYLLFVCYTDAILFGYLNGFKFLNALPVVNCMLMLGVIAASLKIRFNAAIIIAFAVDVLLLVPSVFLVLTSVFTGRMNIDFFRSFTA